MAVAAPAGPAHKPEETLREQVRKAAPGLGSLVIEALSTALQTTKRVFVYCPHCKHKVQVDVPDARETVAAAKTLMEQSEGRPGVAVSETDAGMAMHRTHARAQAGVGDVQGWLEALESVTEPPEAIVAVIQAMRSRVTVTHEPVRRSQTVGTPAPTP